MSALIIKCEGFFHVQNLMKNIYSFTKTDLNENIFLINLKFKHSDKKMLIIYLDNAKVFVGSLLMDLKILN